MEPGARYDWDEHNEGHVAAHRVRPPEVEEVPANDPIHIETRVDARSGEERVLELGHTCAASSSLPDYWTVRPSRTPGTAPASPTC
jgi:uncharacterized DUF497 family protein